MRPAAMRVVLLCFAWIAMDRIVVAQHESARDSVTCSLHEYQELFQRAHHNDLERDLERQRVEMQKTIELKEQELKAQSDARMSDSWKRGERQKVLPSNAQLVHHDAVGTCHLVAGVDERSFAAYNFTLDIRVFDDKWTSIPLVDSQTIVSDWKISRAADDAGEQWQQVNLGLNTFLTEVERQRAEADEEPWKDHTLVTNVSGLYRIQFQAHIHVRSNRQVHGLQLNLLYPLSESSLRLFHDESVHIRELNVEPPAFLRTTETGNYTDIDMRVPSTRIVSVKWRMPSGAESKTRRKTAAVPNQESSAAEGELGDKDLAQATVVHDSLHSIDDSLIQTLHSFKYLLDSEQSLNHVEIHFPGNARVTSVVAHGMSTWRTTAVGNATQAPNASAPQQAPGTAVHVSFKSSAISREVVIMVTTELEFAPSAQTLSMPSAVCQGVLRQTGTVAIEKVANVEVYERSSAGAARLGPESIPSFINGRTNRPIVLAYKFLAPRHSIELSVIHHEELQTLEAVVDAAQYKVLVVESRVMQSILMVLQNTQRQYMEIRGIPQAATIWATRVNSVSTKPVRGGDGAVLVPLMVASGGGSHAPSAKTSVELAWLAPGQALDDNGTLVLDPPRVDMPVSSLSVELHFPEKYDVNFTGTLRRVPRFTQSQPSPVNYQTGDDVVPKDFDFASMPPPSKGDSKAAGVKPKVPREGRKYLFEELLVINGSARLAVSYGMPVNNAQEAWTESVASALGKAFR